jgi:hypothetical protein
MSVMGLSPFSDKTLACGFVVYGLRFMAANKHVH